MNKNKKAYPPPPQKKQQQQNNSHLKTHTQLQDQNIAFN